MKHLLYKIALTKVPLVGAVIAKNLISYCGGVKEVFETPRRQLLKVPGVGPRIAANLCQPEVLEAAEQEVRFLEKYEVQALFFTDSGYPERLRHFADSPVMLYYKGTADLNHPRIVAVVGTRSPTEAGKALCEAVVEGLRGYQVLVLSGLAYGIDITAHRQALRSGLDTVAVLGHGLDRIYPARHQQTAHQMLEQGGLLTEFPSHTKPDRENFPMRNRIIAGLADAVVVVETARSGGSIITAEIANSYNKDVFALPGRVRDPQSKGCNYLIKNHKAALVESADDLVEIMRWEALDASKAIQQRLFVELSEEEHKVMELLKMNDQVGIDNLSYQLNRSSSETAALLLELEFKGLVKSLPGKHFMLTR